MKFYILSRKDGFNEDVIDESFLDSVNAPSLIAQNLIKKDLDCITCYLYLYDEIIDEIENVSYSENEISFINGLISYDTSKIRSIDDLFVVDTLILGDFQAIHLDSKNAIIKTSDSSIYPMFYYEDEYCSIISNELKLIVASLNCFKKSKFANFYDDDYIFDIFKSYNNKVNTPRNTIFKNTSSIFKNNSK